MEILERRLEMKEEADKDTKKDTKKDNQEETLILGRIRRRVSEPLCAPGLKSAGVA